MEIGNLSNFSSSLQGIQNSQKILNSSAQKIASGDAELEKEMTNQIVAEKSQAANVTTVQTREEMLDELMNMRR